MNRLLSRYGAGMTSLILGLTLFWVLTMIVLPYLILLNFSFLPYIPNSGGDSSGHSYTLSNYATFFSSPIHIRIFGLTVFYSSIVTALCLLLAYPVAYFLAKVSKPRSVASWFIILLIPLSISEVLRSFSWVIILDYKGPLNAMLTWLGWIDRPIRWRSGFNGVIIGLVYTYVLFMVFPIYNAIQAIETSQIEAATDLGSPIWRTHWRVVIPQAKPGIASGCIMVFMLSAGSILVPSVLGSTTSRWFTEIIQQWMFDALDWNTGAAYAFLLLILCTTFVSLVMRLLRVQLVDVTK